MRQLTENVFIETEQRGSNHGIVTTTDGIVLIDRPAQAERHPAPARRTSSAAAPLRYILNTEPHGDHWTVERLLRRAGGRPRGRARRASWPRTWTSTCARVATFGPDEPRLLEGYRPNAPVITFKDEMRLHVGNTTFRMISMPGHTPYQAAVVVEEEGVVFTSDNIFCKCHTWLQEADPDAVARGARFAPRAARWRRSSPATGRSATRGTSTSRARSSASGWTTCAGPSIAASPRSRPWRASPP